MIRVVRGDEPPELRFLREDRLETLRGLGREPTSDDIDGYKLVGAALWRAQHYKCCYCEYKIPKNFNDVEHYRPKARADRRPGSPETHGYWWLAFTWSNLLYACPECNRSAKNARFPLARGDVPLRAEQLPPGSERPLLLDPGSSINPVEHLVHVQKVSAAGGPVDWWVEPRDGSTLGVNTIDVLNLNRSDLIEARNDHVDAMWERGCIKHLLDSLHGGKREDVVRDFGRAMELLVPQQPYLGLTYDALCALIPDTSLRPFDLRWPAPGEVGLPHEAR